MTNIARPRHGEIELGRDEIDEPMHQEKHGSGP